MLVPLQAASADFQVAKRGSPGSRALGRYLLRLVGGGFSPRMLRRLPNAVLKGTPAPAADESRRLIGDTPAAN